MGPLEVKPTPPRPLSLVPDVERNADVEPVPPVQLAPGAELAPDVEIACPRCRAQGVGTVARFELRLSGGLGAEDASIAGGSPGPAFDLASAITAMTRATANARVASVGRNAHVVRIPDGQFVVQCSVCDWARRFAPEQIRQAAVISTLIRLRSPGPAGSSPILPTDEAGSLPMDLDWEACLGEAAAGLS